MNGPAPGANLPVVVGITGASGVIYGVQALRALRELGVPTHLVVSKAAAVTLGYESDMSLAELKALADVVHPPGDIAAPVASGSFRTRGMLIAPCSVRTFSEIATGVTSSLMSRAADVVLKERRRLVLGVRETPLHLGHLRTLTALSEMGAVVAPIVPAFYARPKSVDELVAQTVGRLLDHFDLDHAGVARWKDPSAPVSVG